MKLCPFCETGIDESSLICPQCRGNVSIGSVQAIRQALIIRPELVSQDPNSLSQLKTLVESIDKSIQDAANKRQEFEALERRIREEKEIEDQRLQDELALVKQSQEKLKREEREAYLQTLTPIKRSIVRNKFRTALISFLILGLLGAGVSTAITSRNIKNQARVDAEAKANQEAQDAIDSEKSKDTICTEILPVAEEFTAPYQQIFDDIQPNLEVNLKIVSDADYIFNASALVGIDLPKWNDLASKANGGIRAVKSFSGIPVGTAYEKYADFRREALFISDDFDGFATERDYLVAFKSDAWNVSGYPMRSNFLHLKFALGELRDACR